MAHIPCPSCSRRGVSSAALFALGLAVAGCHGTPASASIDGASPSASIVATPTPAVTTAPTSGDIVYGAPASLDGGSPDRMHGTVDGGPTGDVAVTSTGYLGSDARVVAGARAGLRSCYQKALANDPTMEGKASFRVEVSATGTAKATTTSKAGLPSDVETCMLHKLGRLEFDAAPAHTVVVDVVAKKQTR